MLPRQRCAWMRSSGGASALLFLFSLVHHTTELLLRLFDVFSLFFFFFWRWREKQMEHATLSFFFSCNRESSWFNVTSKSDTALLLYSPFFFFRWVLNPTTGKNKQELHSFLLATHRSSVCTSSSSSSSRRRALNYRSCRFVGWKAREASFTAFPRKSSSLARGFFFVFSTWK